jgi:tRNA (cytidine/uridine-2'-O-)-methyltransferase
VAAAPTAATAPVATKRKSRRVGWSAEDAVVTIPSPFLSAASGTALRTRQKRDPEEAAGARGPRGGRKTAFSSPNPAEQAVQNRSIGTLAVRAQARYRLASVQCTKSAPDRDLFNTFHPRFRSLDTMHIALFQPDIPQNTGTILRLCACLGAAAHIIEPAGFPISDRHFRRAGMDYLDHVALTRHDSWQKFEQWRNEAGFRLVLFTTKGAGSYLDFSYRRDDVLLFGRESVGVTADVAAAVNARHEKPRGHMLGPRVVPVTPLSKPKYPPKGQATDATRVANITRVHEIKNTPLPTPPKPDFLTRVIYEKHVASVAADQRVTKDRCQATHATAVSYILPAPRDTRHIDLWMTQLHDEIAHWQHYGQLWQKGKMSLPRVDDQPTIWDENDPEFKSALATYQAWMAINPGTPRGQKRRISSTK